MAESIGIIAEENDTIYRISGVGGSEFVYSKKIDSIKIGEKEVVNFPLEFGAMNYGFDLLQEIKALINIDQLTLEYK
ncbi:hypothetical protein J14TS2_44580 [Bacillus sp. J14TS2]|nr:hypothetical protein J14TS2_44580 [Bacillus sp. J14TS2]